MSRFDRYLLSQLLAVFGFFALVLVSVYWVNRAVGLFDRLIGDGQSAVVFVEFSLLALPNVIRLVLPIAAFAAAVYVTNRMMRESELVTMQATGSSAFRLARPVLIFGLIVTSLHLLLMNVLVPRSDALLKEREAQVSQDVTARYLKVGEFMHPSAGVTLFIGEMSQDGQLRNVFLFDDRDETSSSTYTAQRALLAQGAAGPVLLMFDGMIQSIARADGRLSVTRYSDYSFDLLSLIEAEGGFAPTVETTTTLALLKMGSADWSTSFNSSYEYIVQELHSRLAQPFLSAAAALVGFAALQLGAFSRFGLMRQILGAVLVLIVLQLLNTTGASMAGRNAAAWPAIYIAPLAGFAIAMAMLHLSQSVPPWRRRPA
ncbi:LPS export ABC transporter permease LptF [Tabrizicola sp. TH137]|uniref:LPS export ABC transporter permease LptF n=1 Tax=Tabrizicola sp. TH137 TaxID=2067452 RepID=UPI000C7C0BB0|nr:LPS export ABC transporter permease LptF [Tabrizicola sp. TH137]PLL13424.1 LPS export ABC transporter permease LptF [Tabrizicola sp. TH137]